MFVFCVSGFIAISMLGHVNSECPNDWLAHGNSCYFISRSHKSNFTEAQHYCKQHQDSHLIEIETAKENRFIRGVLRSRNADHHWMGLTDEATEGIWVWYTSGTEATVTAWGVGEPSSGGEEDCVVFDVTKNYRWTDTSCAGRYEPLCEISYFATTVYPDLMENISPSDQSPTGRYSSVNSLDYSDDNTNILPLSNCNPCASVTCNGIWQARLLVNGQCQCQPPF